MMSWYGNGMGAVGWLDLGVFSLILLGLIGWLVVRLLPDGITEAQPPRAHRVANVQDARPGAGRDGR